MAQPKHSSVRTIMKRKGQGSPPKNSPRTSRSPQRPPIDVSELLIKVKAYCATDSGDLNGRNSFRLTDEELTLLHRLAWLGVVPWEDYYELQDFETADFLWRNRKEGLPRFRTIDQLRAWVRWKETKRHAAEDGTEVTETVYHRFLPLFTYIQREIVKIPNRLLQETVRVIKEVEFSNLHREINFDAFWAKACKELQEDAAEHFKWSVEGTMPEEQREQLKRMVLLSKLEVRLVYSASQGLRKESKAYSLAEAYAPLLGRAAKNLKQEGDDTDAQQLDDLLETFSKAILVWDPLRAPLAAWLKFKMDKETKGLSRKIYLPPEQQPNRRANLEECDALGDRVGGKRRSRNGKWDPCVDPNQTPIPVSQERTNKKVQLMTEIQNSMREIMTRELGEQHYQRRYLDDICAAKFAEELVPPSTRDAIAKREERARRVALNELTDRFGHEMIQDLLRDQHPS